MLDQRGKDPSECCKDTGCFWFWPDWKRHCTARGSFHMPLLCEVSQTEVPARNLPAHWRMAPYWKFWVLRQIIGDVFSGFDLPSLGLVANHSSFLRYCHNCTLCPYANNWHIWPSAPNSLESKTLLRGWNSRFTSSGSFHMSRRQTMPWRNTYVTDNYLR